MVNALAAFSRRWLSPPQRFSGGEDPLSIHLILRLHTLRTADLYNERLKLCRERGYGSSGLV